MAAPRLTPFPPTLQKALERDLATGTWSNPTRDWFVQVELRLDQILRRLDELEARVTALEP